MQVPPTGGLQGEGRSALGVGGRCEDGVLSVAANLPRHVALQASKWLSMALPGGCVDPFIHSFIH